MVTAAAFLLLVLAVFLVEVASNWVSKTSRPLGLSLLATHHDVRASAFALNSLQRRLAAAVCPVSFRPSGYAFHASIFFFCVRGH